MLVLKLAVVCPPGLHKYAVIALPEEAVALAETAVAGDEQVITLELLAVTVGVVLLLVTVTLAVDVHPLLWVTVTV